MRTVAFLESGKNGAAAIGCLVMFLAGPALAKSGSATETARASDETGAERIRVLTVNPYRDVDWPSVLRLKANLHTHTTESDGVFEPQQAVDAYHTRDYSVLALTDHNAVTYPWTAFESLDTRYTNRNPMALGMLAICGNELSRHHHALSLFSDYATSGSILEVSLTNLDAYSTSARSVLCHPAMHWPTAYGPTRGFSVPLVSAFRALALGDFTVEAWFRTSDTNRNVLFGNYSTVYQGAVNLELYAGNRVRLYIQSVSGATIDLNLSADELGITVGDGAWHHLAGVRGNSVAVLYLDGKKVGQTGSSASFELQGDSFFIGRDTRTGTTEFTGALDNVRFWTRGLVSNEVARLAAGEVPGDGVASDGLLAEYAFDRPAQVEDTADSADGPFPAVRDEPGYRVAMTSALAGITAGDFALEGWFRTTDTGRNILMGNFANGAQSALNLELHTGNRVRLYIQPPTGSGSVLSLFATPESDTRDGRWRHLAGVRIGATVYLYLDGTEMARTNDTAGAFSLQGSSSFYLGRDARLDATVFDGDLAFLRLWNRGLSAAEVARLAAEGRSASVAPTNGLLACYALEESTLARDTAGNVAGPFEAESTAFSSLMRSFDVPAALQSAGRSSSAANFDFTVSLPTEVPAAAVAYYAGLYRSHGHLRGMEVVNGTRPLTEYALDRELWDALLTGLMPERPVWGFADDDMHSAAQLGRDSECFFTSQLTEDALRQAMDAGAFTFSTTRVRSADGDDQTAPPAVAWIAHDGAAGAISLSATSGNELLPASAYAWVSGGKTICTGTNFCYRTSALTGAYVRVEITGPGGTTFTNPFGFQTVETAADSDLDGLPDWWEWAYFNDPTSVVASAVSPSGMTVAAHYIAGSDPRDPSAVFLIGQLTAGGSFTNALRLRWPSASGRVYDVEYAPSLNEAFEPLDGAAALEADPPYNEYDVPRTGSSGFYRIRVRLSP